MEQILMTRDNLEKLRHDLRLQRRTGIKVKLDFDDTQWWTLGFVSYMENIASSKQIKAAKNYVNSGSVVEMNVNAGVVEGKVQDSRKAPYHVRLYSSLPKPEQLEEIKRRLSEKAIYSALLLSGEMPAAVYEIFTASGVALMPQDYVKGRLLCSCPEPQDICKHILAVMIVLIGAFDRDPFLLLKMRGLDKEDILSSLTKARGESKRRTARQVYEHDEDSIDGYDRADQSTSRHADESLVPMDATFYANDTLCSDLRALHSKMKDDSNDTGTYPPLFDFPLWRGETSFKDSMYPYYESVRKMLRSR